MRRSSHPGSLCLLALCFTLQSFAVSACGGASSGVENTATSDGEPEEGNLSDDAPPDGMDNAQGTSSEPTSSENAEPGTAIEIPPPSGMPQLDPGEVPVSSVALMGDPIYTRVQRLTIQQWERAVTDLLRLEQPSNLSRDFEAEVVGFANFSNNERVLEVNGAKFADFEAGAEAAAALATSSPEAFERLYSGTDAAGFVSTWGRRAFRRPLTETEQTKYEAVFARGQELYGDEFVQGAALVIRAMLQSPHFLYRVELGPSGEALNSYEAAAKLSLSLLGTTPSDALLDEAEAAQLASADDLERVAREMFGEAPAVEMMRDFHRQLYRVDAFRNIIKVDVPEFDQAMVPELQEISYRFFDRVFTKGEGLNEILTSPDGFVGPLSAGLYGVDPLEEIVEMELGSGRIGFFLQVPWLMYHGANVLPDPINRGIALNEEVLCNQLPSDVAVDLPQPPPPDPNQTNRQRVQQQTEQCGGVCHGVFIDPLGFAFEGFDGMGQPRELDNGQVVDSRGDYPFADGERSFDDAQDLLQLMADTRQAHTCYAKNVASYELQRDMVEEDRPLLESLAEVSANQSLKELVVALVRSPAYRVRAEETP